MAIKMPEDSLESADLRGTPDLESIPDSKSPKWLRTTQPSRRKLVIAGSLVLLVPVIILSVAYFRPNPEYAALPTERPDTMSLCDYYATKKFYGNSASTQKQLVQAIVDKAFVGAKNPEAYFGTKSGALNGLLRPGDYMEVPTDLTKYYDGSSETINVDGKASRVSLFTGKNFTQYGREYPEGNSRFQQMKESMYRYYAPMLGCSIYGNTVDKYTGTKSMKEIHKFMDLSNPRNWDWKYYIHQFSAGTLAAGFSDKDAGFFEIYMVDTFGPRIDKKAKKYLGCFENPVLQKSELPPAFDRATAEAHMKDVADILVPYSWKRAESPKKREPVHVHADYMRRDTPHHAHRRADYTGTPPPLTAPDFATATPTAPTTSSTEPPQDSEGVPPSVLPIALGAGIGAGLAVIAIGIGIAYLVIRKRKIAKRNSMPSTGLKPGHIELQSEQKGSATATTTPRERVDRRVDRSEHGNAVGGSKHKKKESQRSVTFEQP